MTGWTRWAIALAVVALVVSATTPSFATSSSAATQWLSPEETAARRDALLKQMIARPNDLDLAFEYANLSSQAGDYEGALDARADADLRAEHAAAPARARRALLTGSAPMTSRVTISSRRSPIRTCRQMSPSRSSSICNSFRSPPIRRPSPRPSSAPFAGRATPTSGLARRVSP